MALLQQAKTQTNLVWGELIVVIQERFRSLPIDQKNMVLYSINRKLCSPSGIRYPSPFVALILIRSGFPLFSSSFDKNLLKTCVVLIRNTWNKLRRNYPKLRGTELSGGAALFDTSGLHLLGPPSEWNVECFVELILTLVMPGQICAFSSIASSKQLSTLSPPSHEPTQTKRQRIFAHNNNNQ